MPSPTEIKAKRLRILSKYEFDTDEYPTWKLKFNHLRQSAESRGIQCLLTFGQYVRLARHAGLTTCRQIGQHRGDFQMARLGDRGDYVLGNCRFVTMEQNQQERKENGGTKIAVEKAAAQRRGQTKETDTGVRKMAETLRGRTAEGFDYLRTAGLKRGKPFELRAPDGKIHRGRSLNAWCRENGFKQPTMNLLCRNPGREFRGWTGRYLKPREEV